MIEFNCKNCGQTNSVSDEYAEKNIRCRACGHINTVPVHAPAALFFCNDLQYAADGITPDFDDIFSALLKHEIEAPAVYA